MSMEKMSTKSNMKWMKKRYRISEWIADQDSNGIRIYGERERKKRYQERHRDHGVYVHTNINIETMERKWLQTIQILRERNIISYNGNNIACTRQASTKPHRFWVHVHRIFFILYFVMNCSYGDFVSLVIVRANFLRNVHLVDFYWARH